jgi:hypothetical protein
MILRLEYLDLMLTETGMRTARSRFAAQYLARGLPVNASRLPSRDAAHHSGSGRLARPSPWGTFTSYSLPAFLAHSESGQKRRFGRQPMTSDLPSTTDLRRNARPSPFTISRLQLHETRVAGQIAGPITEIAGRHQKQGKGDAACPRRKVFVGQRGNSQNPEPTK